MQFRLYPLKSLPVDICAMPLSREPLLKGKAQCIWPLMKIGCFVKNTDSLEKEADLS